MAPVVFTRQAREDLIDIWLQIAEDNPAVADRVLDRHEDAAAHRGAHPQMGAARDDIRPGLRFLINGPYLLLNRLTKTGVEIVRAVHGRRDLFGLF